MHLKSKASSMASLKVDDQDQRQHRKNSCSSNNNNASTSTSTTAMATTSSNASKTPNATSMTAAIENNNNNNTCDARNRKRLLLETRKAELEKKLNEKNWFLQQIQKQESMMLSGHREFLTLDDLFVSWSRQYRQEQQSYVQLQTKTSRSGSCSSAPDCAILRRKSSTTSKENLSQNHQNRNSGLSNRSSEYDNFQPNSNEKFAIGLPLQPQQQQQHQLKSALKKRPTPLVHPKGTTFLPLQRQTQELMLQQHDDHISNLARHHSQPTAQQWNKARAQSPQPQQRQLSINSPAQFDGVSMYSLNSANVATMRQQHISPQQQPIVMQCDKYYLSPTQQNYNEGGFIKSSHNIKEYISPLNSPMRDQNSLSAEASHKLQAHHDNISLAPSYMSLESENIQQARWHSQTHIGAAALLHDNENPEAAINAKSHSIDMLAHDSNQNFHKHWLQLQLRSSSLHPSLRQSETFSQATETAVEFSPQTQELKPKTHDEVSLSSLNSEKRSKTKQWLESSLDSPIIRSTEVHGKHIRDRNKLSSQSMSTNARHYSMSSHRGHGLPNPELIQHEDMGYTKLSQSTSHLNVNQIARPSKQIGISAPYALDPLDIPPFACLPPKPNSLRTQQIPPPPPRPPPLGEKSQPLLAPVAVAATTAALSPDIRIESPKNMTVVQQATFQPYKEVTKPFEMSDFYKYSTKFKQKDFNINRDINGN